MLYHLFEWLNKEDINFPGSELYRFITFRVLIAILLSLLIATVYGKKLIRFLQRKQVGESVRDLGLAGQSEKKGTPTMGGIIIILAILIPTLLVARLDTVYVILMIISTIWLHVISDGGTIMTSRIPQRAIPLHRIIKAHAAEEAQLVIERTVTDLIRAFLVNAGPPGAGTVDQVLYVAPSLADGRARRDSPLTARGCRFSE